MKNKVTAIEVAEALAFMVGVEGFYAQNGASQGAMEGIAKVKLCLRELSERKARDERKSDE